MRRQGSEPARSRLVLRFESLYVGFMDRHGPRKHAPSGGLEQMVASIGVVASPSQGVSYYQRDGYYAQ